jgi:hypothetical protein
MRDWLDGELRKLEEKEISIPPNHFEAFAQWVEDEGLALDPTRFESFAIEAAWRGDIRPLHDFYPHLTPFLFLPTMPHGQHRDRPVVPPLAHEAKVDLALKDAERIRDLWKEHKEQLGGQNRRTHDGEKSAGWFAAARHGVTERDMKNRKEQKRREMKKRGELFHAR